MSMELGVYSFAELQPDPRSGETISPQQRVHQLLEEIALADEVGLDVFGLGEHHRPDFVSSSPAVMLAAGAARTSRIRLTSAVNVLSSDDPVRVFQQFASLDLVSNGRAEIMAGRGSFIESFPLFGYDLEEYDDLFDEKLDLLLKIRAHEKVTWSGKRRAPIDDRGVYPRPVQNPLPVWIAVGGTPESVFRAGTLGLPLALAIIGGQPARFVPLIDLYRDAASAAGHDIAALPVGINAHGYIGDDTESAIDEAYPYHEVVMNKIGRERGWPPLTLERFRAEAGDGGALVIGDAQTVAAKIVDMHRLFGMQRFLLQISVGTMPHEQIMRAIERFGREVVPLVRSALA
jgi:probable LLM family oxidoreductase